MDGTFPDPNDGVLLASPAQAARLVDRTPRTIYAWIAAGRVKVRYAQGGAMLVEVRSLFTQTQPTARPGGHERNAHAVGNVTQPAA